MTRIVHVTRLPPSPSGVALFAHDMNAAYALLGEVEDHRMPPDPHDSQSFPLAWRTWRALRRRVSRHDDAFVVVEIAGRGVAETWAAWLLTLTGRRVWVTVHDVPAVSGGAFLSRSLDRRRRRWLGVRLSRTLGRRVERGLLRRAERVMVLSDAGARALAEAYRLERPVLAVPHVIEPSASVMADRRILVPGYVGDADAVSPLVRGLVDLPRPWRLVVGAAADSTLATIRDEARLFGVEDRIDLLGLIDEDSLDREFCRAAIVVRWRPGGWSSGPAAFAVSGPVIRALGRGCAVVSNDRRGVAECLAAADAVVVGDGEEGAIDMMTAVARLVADDELRVSCAERGLAHAADRHTPASVAALLRGAPA
ncbi:glycosyltransferase [Planctomonas sp. JC2975]|uniref:glycosyltransferase family protein n=1 Tax=Planctomonas sp. JC2975 TaxID=2729626 RepID=UPI001475EF32|nr:glycosyltransferase [Planctomonas sp. JC2975]NNC11868.1 glycosyltransferase [Planctomonas sp. JC2975]